MEKIYPKNEKVSDDTQLTNSLSLNAPKISVIIPVYNQEIYIKDCLSSLQVQTLTDWEAVCIDDGSTDSSLSILHQHAASDERVMVIHQENHGVGYSRNKAIDLARGEFLFFLDPDDWVTDKDVFQDLYTAAVKKHVSVCGGSMQLCDLYGVPIKSDYVSPLNIEPFTEDRLMTFREYQFHFGWTRFLYDRKFIVENGLKLPAYSCYEDPVFFVRVMDKAETFFALKRDVYSYRKNPDHYERNYRQYLDMTKGMTDIFSIARDKEYRKLTELILLDLTENGDRIVRYLEQDHAGELREQFRKMNDILYPGKDMHLVYRLYNQLLETKDNLLKETLNSETWKIGNFIVQPLFKGKTMIDKLLNQ